MFAAFGASFDEAGGAIDELGRGELGDAFGVEFDELDDFGCEFSVCSLHLEMRLMSLGERLMTLGVGQKQELGNEFGGDFDEFDEFGGAFCVCLLHLEMRLISLGVFLMSLGVGLGQELGDEFGVDFDEFDEFWGCVFCVFAAFGDAFDEFGGASDEFGCGLEAGAWR